MWSGTGIISGSGDGETITLNDGQYEESEVVDIGANQVEIVIDEYGSGSGGPPVIKYKDGDDYANCIADTWHIYTVPFLSTGYVQIRVEN